MPPISITKSIILSALGVLGFASACAVDSDTSPEEFGFGEEAVCSNESGTNAAMASLAVATAMELKRWQPRTDFYVNKNGVWKLDLTWTGKQQCGGSCKNVEAILAWQNDAYAGKIKFPGGETLAPDVFRSRLISRYDAQRACDSRPSNQPGNCSTEPHTLKFMRSARGSCDTNYYFHAYKPGTTTNISYPANLKNQLIWAGWDQSGGNVNPYLAFDVQGDDVQIDPTAGSVMGDPAASGSCPSVCVKASATNISNSCCVCNGRQGKLHYTVAPPMGSPYMFSCR